MTLNEHEYSCEQKCEGKWIIFKLLLLLLYTSFTLGYFYFIVKIAFIPLGALIPLFLWIMVYFTWRYTNPDYKYTIDAGKLLFSVSHGKKTKKKLEIHISEAMAIAPREKINELLKGVRIQKSFSALPSKSEKDAYAIVFKKETKVCILYLKVTRDTMKALYYYNKNTIQSEKI